LGTNFVAEFDTPGRQLAGEAPRHRYQLAEAVRPQGQIVGVAHHVAEAFKFAKVADPVGGNEGRPNAR
jgi:hypothetical protein